VISSGDNFFGSAPDLRNNNTLGLSTGNPSIYALLGRYSTTLILQNNPLGAFAHIVHIRDK